MFFKWDSNRGCSLDVEVFMPEQNVYRENLNQLYLNENQILVPFEIFRQGLSGLQAITKFLVEQKGLSFSQISNIINRDQRTIWSSYDQAKKKSLKISGASDNFYFDVSLIKERDLSVLEHICLFLRREGKTISVIAGILDKSPKTVWTVLNRCDKKLGGGKK